jgi:hypothetical protein
MKKLLLLMALCLSSMGYGQTVDNSQSVELGDEVASQYSLSLHAGYGHNLIYGSHANFDLGAYMPINQYFEMDADLRVSTANFYTVGLQLRPKFALPVGEMFIEDRLMANLVVRNKVNEFAHAISLGYRMQYVSVQLGLFSRVIVPQPYEKNSNNSYISEPFKLLYRVEAFVRPKTSCWNIAVAISNIDDYMMERPWNPMLYLRGWYDVDDHWRVHLGGKYKNAGMFHMNAHYFAAEVGIGAEYRF